MIIKSFIILSTVFSLLGLNSLADKFDQAIVRDWSGNKKEAVASASNFNLPDIMPLPKVKNNAPKITANGKYFLLADADTGKVLAKSGLNTVVPIASTTKIMTAVIALENYNLHDVATVSSKATSQVPSIAYLKTGEKITIENLLNCMLISSGNDAAYAIAEHMSEETGGIDLFVSKMNEKAKELGMKDTYYDDPAGLSSESKSTVYDLFLITKYALKNPVFQQIVKKSAFTAKNVDGTIFHSLKQSNRLITEYYPGAIGVKTGFTDNAGHCLVGAATREGHTLISIVLNTYANTPTASAEESRRLLDWGFNNITWQ